ncbi:MAG: lipoyl(octanoyl) transferase LipB [Bacteroidales bacterium]
MEINYINWRKIDYRTALERQILLFNEKINRKLKGDTDISQDFIVCEHNDVYTLGLHGKDSNLLITDALLRKIGAEIIHTNRGGDITYHGPGQITGYPILDIDRFGIGIREYINIVEQSVIDTMLDYGIKCERLHGATGVWIDAKTTKARKICAIGVKASRGITMHGFALNVNTDLRYFSYINPCGFTDKGVTSMQTELQKQCEWDRVAKEIYEKFKRLVE